MDSEFTDYLIENGIVSQLTAPGTPPQNGVAEKRNDVRYGSVYDELFHAT